ncbi:hypothetical protein C8Q73DRAFT_177675 [Cubamyces lactineus]|nr:hypothetical protein C8Q73DRAFT_177675 [Cubamyces lactineus]
MLSNQSFALEVCLTPDKSICCIRSGNSGQALTASYFTHLPSSGFEPYDKQSATRCLCFSTYTMIIGYILFYTRGATAAVNFYLYLIHSPFQANSWARAKERETREQRAKVTLRQVLFKLFLKLLKFLQNFLFDLRLGLPLGVPTAVCGRRRGRCGRGTRSCARRGSG